MKKKITNSIYKAFINIYRVMPLKKYICIILKEIKVPHKLFYKDLKFNDSFNVKLDNKKFKMIHYGGTIENETFWNGIFTTWENETGWIWKQLCVFSNVIFDIGANTGIYSLVAKTINTNSKVIAFEPSNNIFQKLELNNQINKFDIVCEKIALSSYTGEQVFYDTPDKNQTAASLSADILKNWSGYDGEIVEYNVKTMTIADYIETNKIMNIDLIKIDIEMHEPEAIKGFGKYLETFKPIIIIEVLSEKVANELNNLINSDNYEIFHLEPNGVSSKHTNFKVIPFQWNFIFFHKDLADKVRKHTSLYS